MYPFFVSGTVLRQSGLLDTVTRSIRFAKDEASFLDMAFEAVHDEMIFLESVGLEFHHAPLILGPTADPLVKQYISPFIKFDETVKNKTSTEEIFFTVTPITEEKFPFYVRYLSIDSFEQFKEDLKEYGIEFKPPGRK